MKKSSFFTLILCTALGLVFALGMCMWLLPEWNMFDLGIILTAVGGGALLLIGIIAFFKSGLHRININFGLLMKIIYCILCALVLGVGMAMVLVWDMMLWGIIVGGVGILMSLFIIPMFRGFN